MAQGISEAREKDCAKHTSAVNVMARPGLAKVRQTELVAGILRVIAEYTDGFCAVRHADDKDLTTSGMVFKFSTDAKRAKFKERIPQYLHSAITTHLAISNL
uniref:hypothetical protein n=1 Tax=Azospirillum argentinense TaxID=2970906 RepID=UPI0010C10241|nr:hypothetical protein [Azospirillum argentinense]